MTVMKLLNYMNEEDREKLLNCIKRWEEMDEAGELWGDFRHCPMIIDHGKIHVNNICKIAESFLEPILIENPGFFSSKELFYLLASIWLHDIGGRGLGGENWEEKRVNHSNITKILLEKYPERYMLDEEDAKNVALISSYHSKRAPLTERHFKELKKKGKSLRDDFIRDGKEIRYRLLAAILQLCDACDRQKSRFRNDKLLRLNKVMSDKAKELLLYFKDTDDKEERIRRKELKELLELEMEFLIPQHGKSYMLSISKVIIDKDRILLIKNNDFELDEEIHMKNIKMAAEKIRVDLDLANEVIKDYGLYIKDIVIN